MKKELDVDVLGSGEVSSHSSEQPMRVGNVAEEEIEMPAILKTTSKHGLVPIAETFTESASGNKAPLAEALDSLSNGPRSQQAQREAVLTHTSLYLDGDCLYVVCDNISTKECLDPYMQREDVKRAFSRAVLAEYPDAKRWIVTVGKPTDTPTSQASGEQAESNELVLESGVEA